MKTISRSSFLAAASAALVWVLALSGCGSDSEPGKIEAPGMSKTASRIKSLIDGKKFSAAKTIIDSSASANADDAGFLLQHARLLALTLDITSPDGEIDSDILAAREKMIQMAKAAVEFDESLKKYAADTLFDAIHRNLKAAIANDKALIVTETTVFHFQIDDMPGAWLNLGRELEKMNPAVADNWRPKFRGLARDSVQLGNFNSATIMTVVSVDWSALRTEDRGETLKISARETEEMWAAMEQLLVDIREKAGTDPEDCVSAVRPVRWIQDYVCPEKFVEKIGTGGRLDDVLEWFDEHLDPYYQPDFGSIIQNGAAWEIVKKSGGSASDYRRAIRLAEWGLRLKPNAPNIYNTLGAAQYRAGDWDAAIVSLARSHLGRRLSQYVQDPAPIEKVEALKPVFEKLDGAIERPAHHEFVASDNLFIAMALWRRGDQDAAREVLALQNLNLDDDEKIFDREARAIIR